MTTNGEFTPAEDSPRGRIEAIEQANDARLMLMAARGNAPDPRILFEMKLNLLLDFAIAAAMREAFDFVLATNVTAFLDEWEEHQRMNALTEGVHLDLPTDLT